MKKIWVIILTLFFLQLSCILLPPDENEPLEIPSVEVTQPVMVTEEPSLAITEIPTETKPVPTFTATVTPTSTQPVPEAVVEDLFAFQVQAGSPVRTRAWTHDCNWSGVAGQVFNLDGSPVHDLVVEAGGAIAGQPILGLALTGRNTPYGEGGYELQLLETPVDSKETVWVQLKDSGGNPLSPQIYLETTAACESNLIILNFVVTETALENNLYIPLVQP